MNKKFDFCLFYPHKQIVSGGLKYFYDIALYIQEHTDYSACVINFKNHPFSLSYQDTKLSILNIEDNIDEVDENTIFFTYVNMLPFLLERFDYLPKAKIAIIDFHWATWNILYSHLMIQKDTKAKQEIFELFSRTNALSFMEKSGYISIKEATKFNFHEKYIPAYMNNIDNCDSIASHLIESNAINIGYIGRLDNDKIHLINNLLANIPKIDGKKIKLHIIGDGNSRHKIPIDKYQDYIDIITCGYIEKNNLKLYMRNHLDCVVAVGMAALEASSIGLPTILMTLDRQKSSFWFLCNTRGYSLGCLESHTQELGIEKIPIAILLHSVIENKSKIGELCLEMCKTMSLENTAKMFIDNTLKTSLTFEDCLSIRSINIFIKKMRVFQKHNYSVEDFISFKQRSPVFYKYPTYIWLIKEKINTYMTARSLFYDIKRRGGEKYTYNIFGWNIIKTYKDAKRKIICFCTPFIYFEIPLISFVYQNDGSIWKLFGLIPLNLIKMLKNLIKILKKPKFFYVSKENIDHYATINRHYEQVRIKLKNKALRGEKIKVGFLVLGIGQFDTIIEEMEKSSFFEPMIYSVPDYARQDAMVEKMNKVYDRYSKEYKNVFKGYNEETKEFLDFADHIDIAFFENPYQVMAHPYHFIWHLLKKDVLTCFQNYGFFTLKFGRTHIASTPFYSSCWRVFIDSYENLLDAQKYARYRGRNAVVTGYAKMDKMADAISISHNRPRILLCPHHTINMKALAISNFLKYQDFFLQLPKMYPEIDFIFRPHPLLFYTLEHYWGKEKTNQYLQNITSNNNIVYDNNVDDFFTSFVNSDGIIHDCGSFTAEYLFTGKPCCYMLQSEDQIEEVFLPMGQKCLENYYKSYNEDDIILFIEEVILKKNDPLKEQREKFSNQIKLNYPNVGKYIAKYIQGEIFK